MHYGLFSLSKNHMLYYSPMNYDHSSLRLHKKYQGKLRISSLVSIKNKKDLSLAYTPGVAAVSKEISKKKELASILTLKGRTVAVISDGSAVLGLGNLGPEAALPVMEGKAVLFKEFAGVDAFPIVLATQNTDEIVAAIKAIAPTFGGINLEDIAAPRCFEIEQRLIKELNIPVFHDDQHGTAIVVLAALTNALKIVKKQLSSVRIVINGAGAAATAIAYLLIDAGAKGENIIVVDSQDTLFRGRPKMNDEKKLLAAVTNPRLIHGGLATALFNADVFIGTSVANVLKPEWVATMADKPIVFAMANPNPEIDPKLVKKTKIAVFGTGRSDLPNQINNVLAFPGVFRGTLQAGAQQITTKMKLAAANAIARSVSSAAIKHGSIVPNPFDRHVHLAVARAVERAA